MTNLNKNSVTIFHEEQQFRQRSLCALILAVDLLVIIPFVYGMFRQLVIGEVWGNRPLPDAALVIIGSFAVLIVAAVTYLLYSAQLVTEVRKDGLYIKFYPLQSSFQRIDFEEIESREIRTYRPIKEYGGWGIRCGSRGKAYNVYGNRGLQLELRNGQRLLIGSQRPEELREAVTAASGKKN